MSNISGNSVSNVLAFDVRVLGHEQLILFIIRAEVLPMFAEQLFRYAFDVCWPDTSQ